MSDLSFLTPSPSSTVIVALPHNATARVRNGVVLDYAQRGRYQYTALTSAKRAELRFRDKRARAVYDKELRALALSGSDDIPDEHAEDVRIVRLALAADEQRRREVEAAVAALRDQLSMSLSKAA